MSEAFEEAKAKKCLEDLTRAILIVLTPFEPIFDGDTANAARVWAMRQRVAEADFWAALGGPQYLREECRRLFCVCYGSTYNDQCRPQQNPFPDELERLFATLLTLGAARPTIVDATAELMANARNALPILRGLAGDGYLVGAKI